MPSLPGTKGKKSSPCSSQIARLIYENKREKENKNNNTKDQVTPLITTIIFAIWTETEAADNSNN